MTGDAVNVAKRFEEAARTGEILIGDSTRRLVENAAVIEPRDPLALKGKSQPIVAWSVNAVIAEAPGYARRMRTPLVGRERELRALREAFEDALSGRTCRLVTILGSAGIGKSRLTAELWSSLDGERVFSTARASRTETGSPSGHSCGSSGCSAVTRESTRNWATPTTRSSSPIGCWERSERRPSAQRAERCSGRSAGCWRRPRADSRS